MRFNFNCNFNLNLRNTQKKMEVGVELAFEVENLCNFAVQLVITGLG